MNYQVTTAQAAITTQPWPPSGTCESATMEACMTSSGAGAGVAAAASVCFNCLSWPGLFCNLTAVVVVDAMTGSSPLYFDLMGRRNEKRHKITKSDIFPRSNPASTNLGIQIQIPKEE